MCCYAQTVLMQVLEEYLDIHDIFQFESPRVHLHVGGGAVTVYAKDMNQPSLPTPFYSVLASVSVFMALSTVFHS